MGIRDSRNSLRWSLWCPGLPGSQRGCSGGWKLLWCCPQTECRGVPAVSYTHLMEHLRPDLETASGLYEMLKETDTWYAAVSGDTLLDLQKEPIKGYLARCV